MSDRSRQHDLVVFGATSFVGKILCRYLADRFGTAGPLRWAIAGRSESKLRILAGSLGGSQAGSLAGSPAQSPAMIVADAADEGALRRLCEGTGAVISTVGPYALYGEPMVRTCAQTGTDYADLTGETQWIARMIERHQRAAQASGARIVHCCGFDSIPSDLGVHFLQREALRRFGRPCTQVKMRVKAMRGGASGGTVASMLNVVKEASRDPALRKLLADPYALCPPSTPRVRQPQVNSAVWDTDFGAWSAPFVMAAINTRVVHRTNALARLAYGEAFVYDEAMLTGAGARGRLAAIGLTGALGALMLGAALPPSRWALERFVLPAPGEGPDEQAQQRGFYDLRFLGRTADGASLRVRVTGDRDPGYGSTAKMLGQAGACIVQDLRPGQPGGGFWTPATAFGDRLIERLRAHSGMQFEVIAD